MKPFDSIPFGCLLTPKKSWQSLKIGRILFQANFQNGRHRPYWKMNFWYTGYTIMCNMSFLTNLMMTNPFSILILQSEVYLTLYAALMYQKREMAPMSMTLFDVLPHQLLFSLKNSGTMYSEVLSISCHGGTLRISAVSSLYHAFLCVMSLVYTF